MEKGKVEDKVVCVRDYGSVRRGDTRIVKNLHDEDGFHTAQTGVNGWHYWSDFELAWQPKPGDDIQVTDGSGDNYDQSSICEFVCMDGELFICHDDKAGPWYYGWENARPIKTTITVQCEGRSVEISAESHKAIFGKD